MYLPRVVHSGSLQSIPAINRSPELKCCRSGKRVVADDVPCNLYRYVYYILVYEKKP